MINIVHPLVTIAIPTYNRAASYFPQALQSAVHQTYPNIEIVVADNCSHDHTEQVVNAYSSFPISYFRHSRNIEAIENFNFCLEQAKGEYFLLLHDDDLIDKDFVKTCMEKTGYSTDLGIIRTGTRVIDHKGSILQLSPNLVAGFSFEDFILGWYADKTALFLCSTLFNTKGLKNVGGFKSKHNLFDDVVAEMRLASALGRFDVKEIKASFREHERELTFGVSVKEWCEDSHLLLDVMCELATEKKTLIKREGLRFFSTINYLRAQAIRSPIHRLYAYFLVYRDFDYVSSPFQFIISRAPILRRIHSQVRRIRMIAGS